VEGENLKKGYIYIILAALLFSTMELASKMIAVKINPYQLTFIRFLIGGLVLLPFSIKEIKSKNLRFTIKDFMFFLFTGTLCVVISMSFFQLAVLHTKASTVAIVFSTNPIFTIPFAFFILKETITKRTILSLCFSLSGILFILNPFNLNPDYRGIILAVLSAITFSLFCVIGKHNMKKYGSFISNCFTFLTGYLILLLGLIFFKLPIISGINTSNLIQIIYLGVAVTGFGYVFYFLAMKETSAIAASTVFFIKPALAPLLALIILHENIPLNTIIGIILILGGSYVSIFKGNNQKRAEEQLIN
jgi:drug/metabolite transporter (DMT)-like permease